MEADDFFANVNNFDDAVFEAKFRYSFDYAYYPQAGKSGTIYSPYSNVLAQGTPGFTASTWALPEIEKAGEAGLIPNILQSADLTKPITREEFCELALLLHEKSTGKAVTPLSPNPFTDTTNPQILKAAALGITQGTSPTTFEPNKTIPREQCAAMLFRAIKAIAPNGDFSIAGTPDFPGQKNISSYAVEATKYMSKIGIIKGDSGGNFMPKATTTVQQTQGYGTATREAAILMSVRTSDKIADIPTAPVASQSASTAVSGLPVGYPSDLIPIYEGGKLVSVTEKTFDGGQKGYFITVDHAGQKDSIVNGHYYGILETVGDLKAMVGKHSYYYGTKGGYWIELDFYQDDTDDYKGDVTIGYYKK